MEPMFSAPQDVFGSKFRGAFGQFATNRSNAAFYFLTSLPIKNMRETLRLAIDALPIADIKFSQMIQRDVIPDHVQDIKDFITGGAGRAVFFPPLLVSIITKDDKNQIIDKFDTHPEKVVLESKTTITWDKNLFRVTLWGSEQEGDGLRRLYGFDKPYHYHHYGAHLDLNPNRSNLVVIDGQHRYKALASLYDAEDFRAMVENIEIPICVVFSPFAVKSSETSGLEDLRQIFVTVNNEGKTVSGHFIELLEDRSYASESVRRLAELWKADTGRGYSLLHHLEWNTYDSKRAGQLNRPYSITTVLVLVEALREHVFVKRMAATLLQLTAIQEDLFGVDPDFNIDEVNDSVEQNGTKSLINDQIDLHIVPALDILFTWFSPFKSLTDEMQRRITKLKALKATGESPEMAALYELFEQHKIPAASAGTLHGGFTRAEIQLAYNEFVKGMNVQQENTAQVTRYTVFHHALVRCWAQLSRELIKSEVLPTQAAAVLIAVFEKTLAANGFKILQPSAFTQRTLWIGDQVNFKPEWAKRSWSDLMLGTLAQKMAPEAAVSALSDSDGADLVDKKKVAQALRRCSTDALVRYLAELEDQTEKHVKRFYADLIPDEDQVEELRKLQLSTATEDRQKFLGEIEKIAAERFTDAQSKLLAFLGLKLDDLVK